MHIRKRVLLSVWLVLLTSCALTLGWLAICRHARQQECQNPYLQFETGKFGIPGKYLYSFDIERITESGALLVFTVPTLPEEAIPGVTFRLTGPNGQLTGPERLLSRCNYQDSIYACTHRYGVQPGNFQLEITIPPDIAPLTGTFQVIVLPHSEFGGLIELLLILGAIGAAIAAALTFFLAFRILRTGKFKSAN